MEYCNLCKDNNINNINNIQTINNLYEKKINTNYYFLIDNKYYQCICYKNCSQYGIYKDKNKWINYIGLLYVSNSIINILYKDQIYKCIHVEYIPKDNIFLKNEQYNKYTDINNNCMTIDENDILKKFKISSYNNIILNKLNNLENKINNNIITLNKIDNNLLELNSKYDEFDYLTI
jgi:hypothetical protein